MTDHCTTDFAYDGPIFLVPLSLSYLSSPVSLLKPLPISSYQEKLANTRHDSDSKAVGGAFCKGKHL